MFMFVVFSPVPVLTQRASTESKSAKEVLGEVALQNIFPAILVTLLSFFSVLCTRRIKMCERFMNNKVQTNTLPFGQGSSLSTTCH